MRTATLVIGVGLLSWVGCSHEHIVSSSDEAFVTDRELLLELVGLDRTITIRSGANGPVYSVSSGDGRIVAANLTEMQLQTEHPQLYELINSAIADNRPAAGGRLPFD